MPQMYGPFLGAYAITDPPYEKVSTAEKSRYFRG